MAQPPPPLNHTKAYLHALLGSRSNSNGGLSPRPANAPIGSARRTSVESSRSSRSTSSRSDEPDSDRSPRSTSHPEPDAIASPTDNVLRILDEVDEDDQPDQLKDLLGTLLPGASGLDEIVLGLLHRHREDLHPTGQKFDLPPAVPFSAPHTPTTASFNPTPGSSPIRAPGSTASTGSTAVGSGNLSRSGSLRKSTHHAATLALQRSNSGLLAQMSTAHVHQGNSRPASPSPLGRPPGPPSLSRALSGSSGAPGPFFFSPQVDDPEQGYSSGGEGAAASGRSPYGSPRLALHAGATEFRPKSSMIAGTGTGTGTGSAPGSRARSPIPSSASSSALFPPPPSSLSHANGAALNLALGPAATSGISRTSTPGAEGRNVWAFNPSSPLGTPKFVVGTPLGSGAVTPSRSVSAAGGGGGGTDSYFGLEGGAGTGPQGEKAIPRDPWKDDEDGVQGGGIDAHATVAALEAVQKNGSLARLGSGLGKATSSSGGSEQEFDFDPFSPFAGGGPAPPKITTTFEPSDRDRGFEDGMDNALEWGMSPAMAREMERFSSWDPFEAEDPETVLAAQQQQRSRSQGHPRFTQGLYPQPHQQPPPQQPQNLFGGPVTPGGTPMSVAGSGHTMTPFDELYASVAGTGITPEQMEEALSRCAFDPVEAMDYLIRTRDGGPGDGTGQRHTSGSASAGFGPQGAGAPGFVPRARFSQGSGNRPTLVSRDSFDRRNAAGAAVGVGGAPGRNSPMGSAPSSPRWGSRPLTPTGEQKTGGPSNRVCRFYLQGACLRSDCRFSHDVSKAVCRFWLRGHCLKGENRCDFAHEIPHVLNARLQMLDAQNEGRRSPSWEAIAAAQEAAGAEDPEMAEFPSLGDAAGGRQRSPKGQNDYFGDPSRTRWAGAVKNGRPVDPRVGRTGFDARRARSPFEGFLDPEGEPEDGEVRPRSSQRVTLRPAALLPTLPTGSSLAQLYANYRAGFLEFGAQRNKCFQRANECFKRGDGAGAKRWSREGAEWNKRVVDEGRAAASRILAERNRLTKDAVASMDRAGRADETADRMHRGKEMGGGVCLGVAHPQMVREGQTLSVKERMEVVMDLHGLHPDEGIDSLERFLLSLHQDGYLGLAFVVVGESKHTGASDPARGAGKTRLAESIVEYLATRTRYPWKTFDGVVCIDPCI